MAGRGPAPEGTTKRRRRNTTAVLACVATLAGWLIALP